MAVVSNTAPDERDPARVDNPPPIDVEAELDRPRGKGAQKKAKAKEGEQPTSMQAVLASDDPFVYD